MKRTKTYSNEGNLWISEDGLGDMKGFRAKEEPEGVHVTRLSTLLLIFALLALLSWMTERDNHPFHAEPVKVEQGKRVRS